MTAQAAPNFPFPKFSKPGFGFSSKNRIRPKTDENEEDWYIPYNGPYEAPRELPNRRKARDSWGDPLELDDDEEEDTLFNDRELHLRYGGHNDLSFGDRHLEGERMGRIRDRAFSVTSGQTVSSGTIDPSRPSIDYRRSTVSSGTRHVLPSYISMDSAGGVGESPVPAHRSSHERNRTTLAGIFSFNAHSRKPSTHTVTSTERTLTGSFVRKPSLLQKTNVQTNHTNEMVNSNVDPPPRNSSSPENADSYVKDEHQRLRRQVMMYADRLSSVATDTDYYNSYYSSLVNERRSDINHHRHRPSLSTSEDLHHSQQPPFEHSNLDRHKTPFTKPFHPYARAIPRNNIEMLSSTPPISISNPPRPATSHNNTRPHISVTIPTSPKLRSTTSSPDLRYSAVLHDAVVVPAIQNANIIPQPIAAPQFVAPKGKDRWLSAETWCDALLFPRPRLKSGVTSTLGGGGSGRIVSPPGSPVHLSHTGSTGTQEPGIASRVLAHSRSLLDLNAPVGLSSNYSFPHVSTSVAHERDPRTGLQSTALAQDDLALPTPVPSLRFVLAQGEQLTNERKAWQMQAQSSFGNRQTRTLVKARSKSLANGQRRGHHTQTSLDYLAAQACLGNQNLHSNLPTNDLYATNTSSSRKLSNSKSSSLAPSGSRSSKSHSRNHSKGESSSKQAVKMTISTAAICGFPAPEDEVSVLEIGDARAASLEGAIKRDGTKVIRLADPVHLPVDRGPPINSSPDSSIRLSSTPSNSSDQRVGIALGTPTLGEDQGELSFHPSHPYAKGGLSFSVPVPSGQSRTDRGVEFAGPHPSINSGVDISQIPDSLARHKLPPHLYLHPYGQRFSRDSYLDQTGLVVPQQRSVNEARDSYLDQNGLLAQYRSGNETPHQNKMWAQLSPGVLREVLPNDIQYSPFTPPEKNISPVSPSSNNSMQFNDTFGVGEALANAERLRKNHVDDDLIVPISQVDGDKQQLQNSLPKLEPRAITRKPIEKIKLGLSGDSDALLLKPALTVSTPPKRHSVTPLLLSDRAATSPTITSTSSSPPLTPCRLGSPNDLDSFQDLFYRPSNDLQGTHLEAALPDTPSPPHHSTASWDRNMRSPKAESGLTTLARQLSQEFELITRPSQNSSIKSPNRQQMGGGISGQSTAHGLEFVFEETNHSETETELKRHAIKAFQASDSLPEDVGSFRSSSATENTDAEDETALLRVGVVESVLTPVAVSPGYRHNSCAGETSNVTVNAANSEFRQQQQDRLSSSRATGASGESRMRSGLNPPLSEATRSSYMTTSTGSRMSGLSDFPIPPKDHPMPHGGGSTYFSEPPSLPSPLFTERQQQLPIGK